ncbi:hypothetical protein RP75_27750 [Agrobacterium arsenijevicii]|uniref:Uncharacterized protein n=1 Tax=Agrobacterium arsenijevicii TaxID=1585697 RepID=A0ABR5CZF5_9HYPH|nr:hypothetical protein RP75_27750 [Agrobacterium arsenijevicii]
MWVGATPTDIAAHVFADILVSACVTFANTGDGRHDLARRAISALEGIMLDKSGLNRMHHTVGGLQAFDRRDGTALDLGRQGETAQNALAIDVNGAGTALSVVAALFRSWQIGVLAKCVEQCRSYVELEVVALAIDLN